MDNNTINLEPYLDKAVEVCKNYLQGPWSSITKETLRFHRISGGLSNHIFRCSLPKSVQTETNEPREVLLRLYGQSASTAPDLTRYITNKVVDNVVFTILSERELGPRLFGVFAEGRLEEFIPARAMSSAEVRSPRLSALVASKMAKIHRLSPPINKEGRWLARTLARFQAQSERIALADVKNEDEQPLAQQLLSFDFDSEIKWLLSFLAEVKSPIVFCHNDVQGGNVLLRENSQCDDSRIMIIDYEFCGFNYRAFDLANHFCEWAYDYRNPDYPFYTCDRTHMPTKEKMISFFRAYLNSSGISQLEGCKFQSHSPLSPRRSRPKRTRANSKDGLSPTEASALEAELVDDLLKEVKAFLLAPSLLWCLWSISRSNHKNIPFGYWHYATDRMKDYQNFKDQILNNNE